MKEEFKKNDLTNGQKLLLDKLERFLNAPGGGCFLLKGYAGTGKTFMMQGLTNYLATKQRQYRLMAPTGRAAKVISQKTSRLASTIHKTIYQVDKLKEYKEKDINGSETYKYYFDLAINTDDAKTVYIVDEASMVSDEYSEAEFFRFGSGHLLKDLLSFINLDHNDHYKKIIFIGDNAQLPPVKSSFSPALNKEYLQQSYGLEAIEHELTEVVRQSSASGILCNASTIRNNIADSRYLELDIDTKFNDVTHVSNEDLLKVYLAACSHKNTDKNIIVAYSNKQVKEYNDLVRSYFFPGQETIHYSDKILVVQNNYHYEIPLLNGDFGFVESVSDSVERRTVFLNKPEGGKRVNIPIELAFRDIVVRFYDLAGNSHSIKCKINENLLNSNQPRQDSDEQKALYVDFKNRYPQLASGSKEFKDTLMVDPYFNSLQIKFGYSVTCHKAQGGEWENVFVNFDSNMGYLNSNYFRWAYTAITRAQSHLYTLNEPHIGILTPKKRSKVSSTVKESAVRPKIVKKEKEKMDIQIHFDMPSGQTFLKSIYYAVVKEITELVVSLDDIVHNQYCEHYKFSKEDRFAEILVYYNAKQVVSKILFSRESDKELTEKLVAKISSLKGKKFLSENTNGDQRKIEVTFPPGVDHFEEFHKRIEAKTDDSNIRIQDVIHFTKYHAKYIYGQGNSEVHMNYYFDDTGKFTRFQHDLNHTTSEDLLQQVANFT